VSGMRVRLWCPATRASCWTRPSSSTGVHGPEREPAPFNQDALCYDGPCAGRGVSAQPHRQLRRTANVIYPMRARL